MHDDKLGVAQKKPTKADLVYFPFLEPEYSGACSCTAVRESVQCM